MSSEDPKKTISIGCGGRILVILRVMFIVLKVLGVAPVAGWSLWLVLSPLLLELGIYLAVLLVLCAILLVEIWSSY